MNELQRSASAADSGFHSPNQHLSTLITYQYKIVISRTEANF